MPLVPKYYRFPPLNPLTWRPAADELGLEYHIHNYHNALLYDRLSLNDMKRSYAQPLQHNSRPKVFFDTTAESCTVELYDISNTLLASMTVSSPTYVLPGNTLNGEQLNTFYFTLPWSNTVETYVQYQLTLTYSNATTSTMLSEMCLLKAYHDNVMKVEYSHHINAYDIWFEQLGCTFDFLVEGEKVEQIPGSVAVLSEGYNKEVKKVKSDSYLSWKYFFGGNHGIADFTQDKLNRILDCKFIRIERLRLEREDQTKLEITNHPNYPLKGVTVQLREFSHDNYTYDESVSTVLNITSYPAGMPYFGMAQTNWTTVYDYNAQAFYNQSDLEDYKDYLNNTFAVNNGLTGVFSRTGDIIQYTNGTNETFYDVTQIVLTTYLTININMASAVLWRYLFLFGSYHVTDWGDGSVSALFNSSTTTPTYAQHTYGSTGNFTVNLFHNNAIRKLEVMEQTHGQRLRNVSGSAPSQLQTFAFRYGDFSAQGTNFDPSFIWPARFTLQHFIMSINKIDGFNAGLFSTNGVQGTTPAWSQLVYTDLRVNSLSSTEVDEIFNDKWQLGFTVAGSTILLAGQSPTQAPTAASATSRSNLTNLLGCTINHD